MITVHQLTKQFDGTPVLKGVDLTVDKGDVIAVIGQSGGGKTTLLRCMNFLETADSGTMTFDGETFNLAKISKRDVAQGWLTGASSTKASSTVLPGQGAGPTTTVRAGGQLSECHTQ